MVPGAHVLMALAIAVLLTGCGEQETACERLERFGEDPGPSAPLEEQGEYVEALAGCMQEQSQQPD